MVIVGEGGEYRGWDKHFFHGREMSNYCQQRRKYPRADRKCPSGSHLPECQWIGYEIPFSDKEEEKEEDEERGKEKDEDEEEEEEGMWAEKSEDRS